MSQRKALAAVLLGAALIGVGPHAHAADLKDLLPNLFGAGGITTVTPGHTGHFTTSSAAELTSINDTLRGQLANFPLPSPAGSFTFQYDPTLGTFTRSTESFGPIYAQRAETIGRRKFSLGFTYTRFTFNELDGTDIRNGDLKLTFFHEPQGPPCPCAFEGETVTATIRAQISSDVFVLSGTYGLLDHLDVSVAIPVIHNDVKITSVATINHIPGVNPVIHVFDNGTNVKTFRAEGESTGVGDVILRAKYGFLQRAPWALAAAVDLQLPTGDEDNFQGLGSARVSPALIASATVNKWFSPRVNVGGHLGNRKVLENEIFYNVGFDTAPIPQVTFLFDLLGRRIIDNRRIRAGVAIDRDAAVSGRPQNVSDSDIFDASIGLKVNPWRNVLLLFNVLVPLNNTGLRDHVTPMIGVEVFF